MKSLLMAALFIFLPSSLLAQEAGIEIVCSELRSDYDPAAVAAVEYVPGVDMDGNPVVPADLDDPGILVKEYIDIPVRGDFIQLYDIDITEGLELDSEVAGVRIYKDGRVEYNGQDLTEIVKAKCNLDPVAIEAKAKISSQEKSVVSVQKPQQDGQRSSDGLKSAPDTDIDGQHIE